MNQNQVKAGMLFELTSERYKSGLGLGIFASRQNSTPTVYVPAANPILGDQFETTSAVYSFLGSGGRIDFINKRTGEHCTARWGDFKLDTRHIGGAAPKKVPAIHVTSTGPYNGFDMEVAEKGFAFAPYIYETVFEFSGTFTGRNTFDTKVFQHIKPAPGLIDKIKTVLYDELESLRATHKFTPFVSTGSDREDMNILYQRGYVYNSRNLLIVRFMVEETPEKTQRNIDEFLTAWGKRKTIEYSHKFD